MRQKLLGTAAGAAALSLRDRLEILRTAWFAPERVGTLANDQMATRLVTSICLPSRTFIDVGAHIGSIIAEVARHDASIRIVAVEAIPEKVARLRRKFPQVEFHNCAVGDATGEVSFFINTRRSGYSSLARPAGAGTDPVTEIKVPLRRLDELVTSDDADAIKIDVEGAELGVLRGSSRILARSRPTLMFESGPPAAGGAGDAKEALYDFLASSGYSVLVPNRVAHEGSGLTREGFLESHLYPRRTTNYFAIAEERRVEIRDRARAVLGVPASGA